MKEEESLNNSEFKEIKLKLDYLDYLIKDCEGLKTLYNYVIESGEIDIDTRYIKSEIEEDLKKIEELKAILEESEIHSTDNDSKER